MVNAEQMFERVPPETRWNCGQSLRVGVEWTARPGLKMARLDEKCDGLTIAEMSDRRVRLASGS